MYSSRGTMESQVTCPLVDMQLVPGASQASRTPPFSQPSIFLRRIPCPPELRYKVEHVLEPLPATGAHRHRRLSPVSCSRRSTCRRRPVVQGGSATRSRIVRVRRALLAATTLEHTRLACPRPGG